MAFFTDSGFIGSADNDRVSCAMSILQGSAGLEYLDHQGGWRSLVSDHDLAAAVAAAAAAAAAAASATMACDKPMKSPLLLKIRRVLEKGSRHNG